MTYQVFWNGPTEVCIWEGGYLVDRIDTFSTFGSAKRSLLADLDEAIKKISDTREKIAALRARDVVR